MAAGIPVAFVHGANGGQMREEIKTQAEMEIKVLDGEVSRKAILWDDAIPPSEIHIDSDSDEKDEEEKRKKNVQSLNNSMNSKKHLHRYN